MKEFSILLAAGVLLLSVPALEAQEVRSTRVTAGKSPVVGVQPARFSNPARGGSSPSVQPVSHRDVWSAEAVNCHLSPRCTTVCPNTTSCPSAWRPWIMSERPCGRRLLDWLSYRPCCKGGCGCEKGCEPCCTPPLYLYFLAPCLGCGNGGCAAHGCANGSTPAAPAVTPPGVVSR